jgi:hypothetical protein
VGRDLADEPTEVAGYPYRGDNGPVLQIERTDSVPPAPLSPPPDRRLWPSLLLPLVLVLEGLGVAWVLTDRGEGTPEQPAAARPTTSPPTAATHARTQPTAPVKKRKRPVAARARGKPRAAPVTPTALVLVPGGSASPRPTPSRR